MLLNKLNNFQKIFTWLSIFVPFVLNIISILHLQKLHGFFSSSEDDVGLYNGTSRIGLAISMDGVNFQRYPLPVFYPQNDSFAIHEWEGGCEDPRIVEFNSTYVMTYTGYDGDLARLMVATSTDLITWTKHGSVFAEAEGGQFVEMWSKSGSIVTRVIWRSYYLCRRCSDLINLYFLFVKVSEKGKQEAVRLNGVFWMYWGETSIFAATSDDLVNWIPVTDPNGTENEFNLTAIFEPREGKFDSDIVEPGPPAILTERGIVFVYNSRNLDPLSGGDSNLPRGTYSAGQVLLNATNPIQVLSRLENYFFTPEKDYEVIGQVNNVVFLQGLVSFNGSWYLYYGTADSKIALAIIE